MRTSRRGDYFIVDWHGSAGQLDLWGLITAQPELVLGKYVAILSWDSGKFLPTGDELRAGWTSGAVPVSPRVDSVDQLPSAGWDEWFVFDDPPGTLALEPHVNWEGFSPLAFGWREKLDGFWRQVDAYRPRHVIGDGAFLYLATRDESAYLRACGSPTVRHG